MIITDYKIGSNKITLELKGEEPLIATYYLKSEEELRKIKKLLSYDAKVEVTGSLTSPLNNTIPNTFNYKKYLANKNIHYTMTIDSLELIEKSKNPLYRIKNFINKRLEANDRTGYKRAFILGDKNNIDSTTYTNYQKIGITHLFALSGMHVGLLSGIFLACLKKLKDSQRYIIVDVILILYGFLVGYPSSIKRCILFFVLNTINKIFHFNLTTIKILLLTICFLIINDYKIVLDVGFQYSVCTVLGIALSSDFISKGNRLQTSFKLSLVAFLFSLPISLTNFYEINFLSVIYNIIFVPFISIIIYPLSLLSFFIPVLNPIFVFFINILEKSVTVLSKIKICSIYLDFNILEILLFYVLLFLIFSKNKFKLSIFLPLIIIIDIILPSFNSSAYVYFFDVGQGDSSLIISPYRKDIIMIDTGGIVSSGDFNSDYKVSDNIISFMKSQGIRKIDLLILSHGDADHAKEVQNIYEEIKINSIKINPGTIKEYEQIALDLIKNTSYTPKNLELTYLNQQDYVEENANSLLTLIKIYDKTILSFGDAPKNVEEEIANKYNLKNIDIAKISHHGSKTSSSKTYLSHINPKISIISSGRNNRFNHPNIETLDTLNELKLSYLNTQDSGSIEFRINKNRVTYNEYKP